MAASTHDDDLESTSIELQEIKRPIDMIPSGGCVAVKIGVIRSDTCDLALNLQHLPDEDQLGFIEADTWGKTRFSAKVFISCDDKNSIRQMSLNFRPDRNERAAPLLEDFTKEYLKSVTRPAY